MARIIGVDRLYAGGFFFYSAPVRHVISRSSMPSELRVMMAALAHETKHQQFCAYSSTSSYSRFRSLWRRPALLSIDKEEEDVGGGPAAS